MAKSKCCNSDIVPTKGSYMGQTLYKCWNCDKYVNKPDIKNNGHMRECICSECEEDDLK